MVQFWYFFFPSGGGELDHGDILTGFVRGSATGKVKSALPGTMVDVWKWAKGVQKNWIHLFIFANEKSDEMVWQWKVERRLLCYSWQPVTEITLWVFILPPREELFVINFMLFTRMLWMRFVCHEKQFRGGVPGVDPRRSKWKVHKPVDVEIDNDNTGFVFEMRRGNEWMSSSRWMPWSHSFISTPIRWSHSFISSPRCKNKSLYYHQLRSGLQKRGAAEFFSTNFEVFGYLMKLFFECLK